MLTSDGSVVKNHCTKHTQNTLCIGVCIFGIHRNVPLKIEKNHCRCFFFGVVKNPINDNWLNATAAISICNSAAETHHQLLTHHLESKVVKKCQYGNTIVHC